MSKLIILLERSNTLLGKIGRLFNKYPFTHITISFDDINYQSFSRRHLYNPFDSGFTIEKMNHYAYEDVLIKKYYLDINDKQKKQIESFIVEIKDCDFDKLGMLLTTINLSRENKSVYNCMSFVARVLEILDYQLDKKYYDNSIKDIEDVLIKNNIPSEELLVKKMEGDEEYMRKISLREIIGSIFKWK